MRKIISLICLLLPVLAFAADPGSPQDMLLDIRSDAPDRHVVVKGDTLWDISGKFFKDPWKWPHIWGLNKETIKDPHWIYPGDVIFLDRSSGTLRIGEGITAAASGVGASAAGGAGETGSTVRLSPKCAKIKARTMPSRAFPPVPSRPFLSPPLVIETDALKDAPDVDRCPRRTRGTRQR